MMITETNFRHFTARLHVMQRTVLLSQFCRLSVRLSALIVTTLT